MSSEPDPTARGPERFRDPQQYVEIIKEALARDDESFLAYLILDGVDQADLHIVEHFEDHYAGWYPDRMSLMRAQVENLGWSDALGQFKSDHDIWPLELQLNWDRIWDHCLDVYDIEERLRGLHVFVK